MTLGGRKIPFDPASLKVLEDLSEATWLIFESRHPFRDVASDDRLREVLRLKLFIRAENHGLANLDEIQREVLETMSRESGQGEA